MSEKKPSYFELLKHPNWQRKRLEILERDGFACTKCGDKENTLHVHHGYYERGLMPWEYPSESLHTLCDNCHQHAEHVLSLLREAIGELTVSELYEVVGFARAQAAFRRHGLEPSDDLIHLETLGVAHGVAMFFQIHRNQIWQARTHVIGITYAALLAIANEGKS